jgi:hypothetical protein
VSSFKFTPNRRGIDEVLEGPGVERLLDELAERVASEIRSNAPVGSDFMDYRAGIDTEPAHRGFDGLEAAVVVDSPGWHLVEYGSVNTAPRAIIANAARAVLDNFEEG